MLREAENKIHIEGILSEVNLNEGTMTKEGKVSKTIGGSIKVRVNQVINGKEVENEVPVSMFATELKKDGTPNPAYTSIMKIKDTFVSIAASDINSADRVRITGAKLAMNEYYPAGSDTLTAFPRINATFVNKIANHADCNPEASFSVEFVVANKGDETNREGEATGRYKFMGVLPQYGGKVDVIPFIAAAPGVINATSTYWSEGDTVKAIGKLNFTSKTETYAVEVDFGEPQVKSRTINVSELIITGGTQTPLDGELAFSTEDIQKGLADRKVRLEQLKTKSKEKKATPAPVASSPVGGTAFTGLGF